MIITGFHALFSENAQFPCQLFVAANDHPRITSRPKVFRGIKAKATRFAHRPCFRGSFAKRILRANCLRRIFNYVEPVVFRNLVDRVHLAAQTEQMDQNNDADSLSAPGFPFTVRIALAIFFEALLNCGRADVVSDRIDIHKQWSRAGASDASSCSKKCVSRRDESLAGPDSKRYSNRQESVCPG